MAPGSSITHGSYMWTIYGPLSWAWTLLPLFPPQSLGLSVLAPLWQPKCRSCWSYLPHLPISLHLHSVTAKVSAAALSSLHDCMFSLLPFLPVYSLFSTAVKVNCKSDHVISQLKTLQWLPGRLILWWQSLPCPAAPIQIWSCPHLSTPTTLHLEAARSQPHSFLPFCCLNIQAPSYLRAFALAASLQIFTQVAFLWHSGLSPKIMS